MPYATKEQEHSSNRAQKRGPGRILQRIGHLPELGRGSRGAHNPQGMDNPHQPQDSQDPPGDGERPRDLLRRDLATFDRDEMMDLLVAEHVARRERVPKVGRLP